MVYRGMRAALVAVACGVLVGIPGLASGQQPGPPSSGRFTAHDLNGYASGYWTADDGSDTTLTIATGGTVTFSYPSGGQSFHNVKFDPAGPQPASCSGLPSQPTGPPWSGSCTFDHAGSYAFVCGLHPDMTGTVVVADAPPGSTPTPLPGTSPTPTPTSTAMPAPQSSLKVTLPARQKGRHVRGSVQVQSAHTRLDVSAWAKLTGRRTVRVAHWLKRSAPAGRVSFSLPLIARARHMLTLRHRLAVTVRVALTPPGGHTLHRAVKATVRPG